MPGQVSKKPVDVKGRPFVVVELFDMLFSKAGLSARRKAD
jgi:hypothetical protein